MVVEGTGEQEELPGSGDRQPRQKLLLFFLIYVEGDVIYIMK